MMEKKAVRLLAPAALFVMVACATTGTGTSNVVGTPAAAVEVDQVEVYGPGQEMPDESKYVVIVEYRSEVGADSESVNKAVAEFRAEAAKLGCDAVLVLSYDIDRRSKQGQSGVGTEEGFAAAGGNMNDVSSRDLKVVGVRWKESQGE